MIGSPIVLNGHPFTIVGVAPQGFSGTEVGQSPDVFAPMTMQRVLLPGASNALEQPRNNWLRMIGRLKRDIDVRQAEAELTALLKPYNDEILKDSAVDTFGPNCPPESAQPAHHAAFRAAAGFRRCGPATRHRCSS